MMHVMKVYLDDEPLAGAGESLTAALEAGREAAGSGGRVIVEVWADGAPAPEDDLANPPAREPYAVELKLVSAEPASVVADAFSLAAEALDEARRLQQAAAESLQTGETSEAMQSLRGALEVWEQVRRSVTDGCALLGVGPGEACDAAGSGADGAGLEELVAALMGRLLDIKRAVASEDWSGLADVLAYDLDDEAVRWSAMLQRRVSTLR